MATEYTLYLNGEFYMQDGWRPEDGKSRPQTSDMLFLHGKKGYGNVTIINHGWSNGKHIPPFMLTNTESSRKNQFVRKDRLFDTWAAQDTLPALIYILKHDKMDDL